ncbi:hypothetical protein IW140_006288 [Coemansia sp. RSA 1813]|nr:hypothetical protein EV178_006261 [Coemansia sp. RSA 1646]KAJ1769561.1 hypothetical protein LPJ74_003923 [Coemansia sp. RSA 1843]KAJ2085590.1 hypothetical protein IW138_006240 [Coemansia sp. RSA 986]KAJ2210450.1 hypothetical protein EV179_006238 [Coemansia sp. RSA 487]KAJ2562897.1 hypothetical protein IW140_006288 [Coemansia sp. RSA 1813]
MKLVLVVSGLVGFMGLVHAGVAMSTPVPTPHDEAAIEKRHYKTITDSIFNTVTNQVPAANEPDVNSNGNANNNNIVINLTNPTPTASQDVTQEDNNDNDANAKDAFGGNELMYAMMGLNNPFSMMGGGMQTGFMQSFNPLAFMFGGMQNSGGLEFMQQMQYMQQMQQMQESQQMQQMQEMQYMQQLQQMQYMQHMQQMQQMQNGNSMNGNMNYMNNQQSANSNTNINIKGSFGGQGNGNYYGQGNSNYNNNQGGYNNQGNYNNQGGYQGNGYGNNYNSYRGNSYEQNNYRNNRYEQNDHRNDHSEQGNYGDNSYGAHRYRYGYTGSRYGNHDSSNTNNQYNATNSNNEANKDYNNVVSSAVSSRESYTTETIVSLGYVTETVFSDVYITETDVHYSFETYTVTSNMPGVNSYAPVNMMPQKEQQIIVSTISVPYTVTTGIGEPLAISYVPFNNMYAASDVNDIGFSDTESSSESQETSDIDVIAAESQEADVKNSTAQMKVYNEFIDKDPKISPKIGIVTPQVITGYSGGGIELS